MEEKIFHDLLLKKDWGCFFSKYPLGSPHFSYHENPFVSSIRKSIVSDVLHYHPLIKNSVIIDSKKSLSTNDGKRLELDLLLKNEEMDFFVEIKTNKSAERNSGTEINAYSKAIGSKNPYFSVKDSLCVLITNFDSGISKESYLYEVIYNRRKLIVYNWRLIDGEIILSPYILGPNDLKDFSSEINFQWVKISVDSLNGIVSLPSPNSLVDTYSINQFTKICSHLESFLEDRGFSGFMIGKILWYENVVDYPNEIYFAFLSNKKNLDDVESSLIYRSVEKFFKSSLSEASWSACFIADPSKNLGFWNDQHPFFGSIGLVNRAYKFWIDKRSKSIQRDMGRHHAYKAAMNVNIFTDFLCEHKIWS
jgi:hypothetical protein